MSCPRWQRRKKCDRNSYVLLESLRSIVAQFDEDRRISVEMDDVSYQRAFEELMSALRDAIPPMLNRTVPPGKALAIPRQRIVEARLPRTVPPQDLPSLVVSSQVERTPRSPRVETDLGASYTPSQRLPGGLALTRVAPPEWPVDSLAESYFDVCEAELRNLQIQFNDAYSEPTSMKEPTMVEMDSTHCAAVAESTLNAEALSPTTQREPATDRIEEKKTEQTPRSQAQDNTVSCSARWSRSLTPPQLRIRRQSGRVAAENYGWRWSTLNRYA